MGGGRSVMGDSVLSGGSTTGMGGMGGGRGGGGRSRQADPPGPRHRPNPPEREGLAAERNPGRQYDNYGNGNGYGTQMQQRGDRSNRGGGGGMRGPEEDEELLRMRAEYLEMQRMQLEQQRRMKLYQEKLMRQQAAGGGGVGNMGGMGNNMGVGMGGNMGMGGSGNMSTASGMTGGSGGSGNNHNNLDGSDYDQDVYDEYRQMMRRQVDRAAQAQLAADREMRSQQHRGGGGGGGGGGSQGGGGGGGGGYGGRRGQDIASQIMDDGLLPVDAGFDIPALRGDRRQQMQMQGGGQRRYPHQQQQFHGSNLSQQQQQQQQQQQYCEDGFNPDESLDPLRAQDAFGNSLSNFNACDKTVSTMSSFDVQSMDMSSLGGFSFHQSGFNQSGMQGGEASGGGQRSSADYNASHMSGLTSTGTMGSEARSGGVRHRKSKKSSNKSALERKLEKVNEAHQRQQQAQAQQRMQMEQRARAHAQEGGAGGDVVVVAAVSVPTAKDDGGGRRHHHGRRKSQEGNNNMASSLLSLGFDAIEEDEITEASYKMSNLGLSEMDMTFASVDNISVRSKSAPRNRRASQDRGDARRSSTTEKRANSEGDVDEAEAARLRSGRQESGLSSSSDPRAGSESSATRGGSLAMDDFNESFKSMEMEDRGCGDGGGGGGGGGGRRRMDPDGAEGGGGEGGGTRAAGRRKDPPSGLPYICSSRRDPGDRDRRHPHQQQQGDRPRPSRDGERGAVHQKRRSDGSMGISDPDMMASQSLRDVDFGVSLESLQSRDIGNDDGGDGGEEGGEGHESSWLKQYHSMENVGGDGKDLWDDEDGADSGTMSEISAPRMVAATGSDGK
ncbi:hypothetical protein ACHAWF_008273 [Thalassiosira exigua]